MLDLNKPVVQWSLLIFLAFIWGSSFILMKKGLLSFSWSQVASLRIFISFLVLSPVIIKNIKKIKKDQWWKIAVAGLLGSGAPAYLFPLAQTEISSSLTGMLNSLVPLFTVVIGLLFFKLSFRWLKITGVILGLTGALGLLFSAGEISVEGSNLWYASLVVLATIMYATNINFIKTFLSEVNAINITSYGFLFIGPLAMFHLFSTDFTDIIGSAYSEFEQQSFPELFTTGTNPLLHLFYVALLAIFGTALAVILFNLLIKKVSAVFSSSVTYIIPVFAIFWGLIDGEEIRLNQLLFIAVILTGVYIVNTDNRLERKESLKREGLKS